jgi:hypothetical protein
MLHLAVDFKKKLFRYQIRLNISLREDFWEENEKFSLEENNMMKALFNEEEVKEAIFESYADGASGPDGLHSLFYQKFWGCIKYDLLKIFKGFEDENLKMARLNYVTVILIPKEPDARNFKKFRPISLLNCSFRTFSKALNNRLINICDRLIASNQTTAFIKGRFILESVVAAH